MSTALDELDRLAEAATPGPWERFYDDYGESEPSDMRPGTYFLTDDPSGDQHPIAQAVAGPDAAYIAAASPEAVRCLVAVARAAEAWRTARDDWSETITEKARTALVKAGNRLAAALEDVK